MSGSSQSSPPPLINQYIIAFEGNSLGYIIYGIYVAVAITNLMLLRKEGKKFLFIFTLFQLVVTTLYNAIQLYSSPKQFLTTFNLAGQSYASLLSPWPNVLIGIAYVLNIWSSDAFLIYRCYIVLVGDRYILAFPALLYLGLVGTAIAYLKVSINPSATYTTSTVRATALSYWSLSVALNIVASLIIAVRFWFLRRRVFHASKQQGAFYLAYIAMTLESALLYTAFGIASLVTLILNSPLEGVFFTILGPIQVLAPALIVNRIARGVSIESDFDSTGTIDSVIIYAVPPRQSITGSIKDSSRSSGRTVGVIEGPQNDPTLDLYNVKSMA